MLIEKPTVPKALILETVTGLAPIFVEVASNVGLQATAVSSITEFKDQFPRIQPNIVGLDCEIPIQDICPLIFWMSNHQTDVPIPHPKLILISATSELSNLLKKFAENTGIKVVAEFDKTVDIDEVAKILKSVF